MNRGFEETLAGTFNCGLCFDTILVTGVSEPIYPKPNEPLTIKPIETVEEVIRMLQFGREE